MKQFKNVDEYIVSALPAVQPMLKEMRQIIKELAPNADERISYGMAGYFYNGALVYIGGFKDHVSLFGAGKNIMGQFADELKEYKTSKGTIQFPLDAPLPTKLVIKLVKACVEENEAKQK